MGADGTENTTLSAEARSTVRALIKWMVALTVVGIVFGYVVLAFSP